MSLRNYFLVSGLALLMPTLGFSTAVVLDGSCQAGNCSSPDTLNVGGSTGANLATIYTFANGDQYYVSGFYGASYGGDGSLSIAGDPSAQYIGNLGNKTAASQSDVLTFSFLQIFNYTSGSLDGFYANQFVSATAGPIAASSTYTAALYYDGESVGSTTVGTGYSGPVLDQACFGDSTICSPYGYPTLPALTNPLLADEVVTLFFGAGSGVGAIIATDTPEPGSIALLSLGGLAMVAFGVVGSRRRKAAIARA